MIQFLSSTHGIPIAGTQQRGGSVRARQVGGLLLFLLGLLVFGESAAIQPSAAGQTETCLSDDASEWQWEHPSPNGQTARVVRWIPEWSAFVAIGDSVISSIDGVAWDTLHGFNGLFVNDFVWTGSAFVAVAVEPGGVNGLILRSTDGENWTTVANGLVAQRSIAWNGSLFVAVGNEATLRTSPDGINWTPVDSGGGQSLAGVVWADSQFVTVGSNSTILTSPDGTTWTPQTAPESSTPLTDVVWDGNTSTLLTTGFISSDDVWVSTDNAVNWQAQTVRSGLSSSITIATIAGDRFWLLDPLAEASTVWSAPTDDLSAWSDTSPLGAVLDIAWNGSEHVFVGRAGNHGPGVPGRAWRVSEDPLMDEDLRSFTAFEGLAVVGTRSGKLGVSNDQGATWTEVVTSDNGFFDLANNDDPVSPRFIAPHRSASFDPEMLSCAPTVSADCTEAGHWSASAYTPFSGNRWRGLNERFFASTFSGLRSSIDGIDWNLFLIDGDFSGIAHYDDGAALRRWIALGTNGSIRTSEDDGATWGPAESIGTTDSLRGGVQLGLDVFVWSAEGNVFRTTDGGVTWTQVDGAPSPVQGMVLGEDFDGAPMLVAYTFSNMYTSLNGLDWSDPIPSRAGNFFSSQGVRWDGNTWIQGGDETVAWAESGLEWQTSTEVETYFDLRAAASIGQTTVAAGFASTLLATVDGGASWQQAQTPVESSFNSLAAGDDVFIAAGDSGGLIRSTDGLAWTQTGPSGNTFWEGVVWGGNGFVAVASGGTILQSIDGISWDERVSGTTDNLIFVGWTGQRYVAVGGSGTVVTSLDGVFWQTEPQPIPDIPSGFSATGLAQRGELSVLVGSLQRTWLSTDHGRTWTLGSQGNAFWTPRFTDARLVGSEIVASTAAQLFTSTDGINWNALEMPTANTMNGLAIGLDENEQTRLFVVGRDSLALSMPVDRPCDPIPPPPDPQIFLDRFELVVP